MKKTVCLILTAIMLLHASTFAEDIPAIPIDVKSLDTETLLLIRSSVEAELEERNAAENVNTSRSFSLHGDIRFGMNINEIENIETKQGFTLQKTENQSCVYGGGIIAGESKAYITYGFDDAGKMFMMQYRFGPYDVFEDGEINPYPSELSQRQASQMRQKYGESAAYSRPAGFSNDKGGNRVATPVTLYDNMINPLSSNGKFNSYEEWLREVDDGYIFIQHAKLPIDDSDHNVNNDKTDIYITYCYFDHDTFQGFYEQYGDDL